MAQHPLRLAAAAHNAKATGPAMPSPYAAFVGEGRRSIKYLRVFSGDDGRAHIEEIVAGPDRPAPGNGPVQYIDNRGAQFLDRRATAFAIFSAPAGHVIPDRKTLAGAPELIYLLGGEATVKTAADTRRAGLGSLILFEDSKGSGHSVTAGPQGYTAVKILLVTP